MTAVTTTLRTTRASEHTLELRDGTHLFYRAWLPAKATDRALIAFHRGHEHSGRLQDVVEELGLGGRELGRRDALGQTLCRGQEHQHGNDLSGPLPYPVVAWTHPLDHPRGRERPTAFSCGVHAGKAGWPSLSAPTRGVRGSILDP